MTSATLSGCRKYRYDLWREWEPHSKIFVVIGLNPSTADENVDDPTIRRCVNFAKAHGCGSLCMLNLFAFRATDPDDMKRVIDPVGPDNDGVLLQRVMAIGRPQITVAAWGKHGSFNNRADQVLKLLGQRKIYCLKKNSDGSPAHPLYLKSDSPLVELQTPKQVNILKGWS